MRKWWSSLVDAAARAFGFPEKPETIAKTRKTEAKKDVRGLGAEVRKLSAQGLSRLEIARRTGLSQDIVGMHLNLAASSPADSAGQGTFFRILQARVAA